jgi:hypothetical protein
VDERSNTLSAFIWIVLSGLVARFFQPGANNPRGFILTAASSVPHGIATWIGQCIGWYRPHQGAGFRSVDASLA